MRLCDIFDHILGLNGSLLGCYQDASQQLAHRESPPQHDDKKLVSAIGQLHVDLHRRSSSCFPRCCTPLDNGVEVPHIYHTYMTAMDRYIILLSKNRKQFPEMQPNGTISRTLDHLQLATGDTYPYWLVP